MSLRKKVINGEQAIVIRFGRNNQISVHLCYICSTPESHSNVDNVRRTVVSGVEPFNPDADHSDDAYELAIDLDDPHLIMVEELENILDQEKAIEWFRGVHPPHIASLIHIAIYVFLNEEESKTPYGLNSSKSHENC